MTGPRHNELPVTGLQPRTTLQRTTIALMALNMTLASSAVSPLLSTIRHDTRMSGTVAGFLVTIPFLCFGLLAPVVARLARRLSAERVVAAGLSVLVAGILVRSAPGLATLFAGTFLIGAAVTCSNVLLPGVIKRRFETNAGPVIGLFTTGQLVGGAIGAGATVPLMTSLGLSWADTLALWAIPATGALLLWLWTIPLAHPALAPKLDHPLLSQLYHDRVAWSVALFFGFQAAIYNAVAAWLPSLFVAHGLSRSTAGLLLALVNVTGMITALTVPILAMRRPSQKILVLAVTAMFAVSLAGLTLAPVGAAILWVVLFGVGEGAGFGLALTFILLRSTNDRQATELSAMTQTVGSLVGALGPVSIGAVHDLAGGWSWSLFTLLCCVAPFLALGLGASRDRHVLPSSQ